MDWRRSSGTRSSAPTSAACTRTPRGAAPEKNPPGSFPTTPACWSSNRPRFARRRPRGGAARRRRRRGTPPTWRWCPSASSTGAGLRLWRHSCFLPFSPSICGDEADFCIRSSEAVEACFQLAFLIFLRILLLRPEKTAS